MKTILLAFSIAAAFFVAGVAVLAHLDIAASSQRLFTILWGLCCLAMVVVAAHDLIERGGK